MRAKELNDRIEKLNKSRAAGEITGQEWEGHMEALSKIAQHDAAYAEGATVLTCKSTMVKRKGR